MSNESKNMSLYPFLLAKNMPSFQCSVPLVYLAELKWLKFLSRFQGDLGGLACFPPVRHREMAKSALMPKSVQQIGSPK